jgi:hypothetical protein
MAGNLVIKVLFCEFFYWSMAMEEPRGTSPAVFRLKIGKNLSRTLPGHFNWWIELVLTFIGLSNP